MSKKTKINFPTRVSVLATAATRRFGHVLPLPDGANLSAAKVAKLLRSLLAAGLVEEHPTSSAKTAWRSDEQGKHTLLRITPAGRQAITASQEAELCQRRWGRMSLPLRRRRNGRVRQAASSAKCWRRCERPRVPRSATWSP